VALRLTQRNAEYFLCQFAHIITVKLKLAFYLQVQKAIARLPNTKLRPLNMTYRAKRVNDWLRNTKLRVLNTTCRVKRVNTPLPSLII